MGGVVIGAVRDVRRPLRPLQASGQPGFPLLSSPRRDAGAATVQVMSAQVAVHTPTTIDERAVRVVAAVTVAIAGTVLVTGWWLVLVALVVDFALRARGHTRWSPLARLARALVARNGGGSPRPVAASPKRFAAGIGAVVSGAAAVAALGLGADVTARLLLVALLVAALLEAAFAFCVGCRLHAVLAAVGVVDECPECGDLSARLASPRGPRRTAAGPRSGP